MLESRKERILFLLGYCLILSLELQLIPKQEITALLVYQYLAGALLLALLAAYIYSIFRNRSIRRRIQILASGDNMEEYVAYVCKHANAKPACAWLQSEKLAAFALSGRIMQFEETRNMLLKSRIIKKIPHRIVKGFHQILTYIKGESVKDIGAHLSETSLLDKVLRLIYWSNSAADALTLVPLAQELLNCPYALYQTVAAIVLEKNSYLRGNLQEAENYAKLAIERSPSPEIQKYVRKTGDSTG